MKSTFRGTGARTPPEGDRAAVSSLHGRGFGLLTCLISPQLPRGSPLFVTACGPWWFRTTDPYRVKVVLYH